MLIAEGIEAEIKQLLEAAEESARADERTRKQAPRRRKHGRLRPGHEHLGLSVSDPGPSPFKYHLELTPAQLQAHPRRAARRCSTASASERAEARRVIGEVLEMLPDEHAIAAIRLDDDGEPSRSPTTDDRPATEPDPPDLPRLTLAGREPRR